MSRTTTIDPPGAGPDARAESAPLTPAHPGQAQRIYRSVLEAMARPGMLERVTDLGPLGGRPAALAPLWAIADLMSPLAAAEESAAGAVGELAAVTGAPRVRAARARLALALQAPEPDSVLELRRGTDAEPHQGALLVQRVTGWSGRSADALTLRLSGPGIKGRRVLEVSGLDAGVLEARNEAVSRFPRGIDLVLVADDGSLAALPRTTRLECVEGVR